MNMFGYETKTTFWDDFTIADRFGDTAIEDTYRRAFDEWKKNVVYLTELVMVLNWKLWQHYEQGHDKIARLYEKLWKKTHQWAYNNLKDDDLTYYFETTD